MRCKLSDIDVSYLRNTHRYLNIDERVKCDLRESEGERAREEVSIFSAQ